MKQNEFLAVKRRFSLAAASVCLGLILCGSGGTAMAQTTPPSLPPGVQDVVKLVHAGMSDDLILAQIKNQGATYNLTADQIIYLGNQGVSQTVIKALLSNNGPIAPASPATPSYPAAPATLPGSNPAPAADVTSAAAPVDYTYFHDQLAPYGSWVQVEGYGWCWRPAVASDPLWRPYSNEGYWVYTDAGWFWQSDYPWGEIAFHYGRWYRGDLGWIWVPGYDWAPAWVCWRESGRYCGWAPLPPRAVFRAGVGLTFGGHVAVDVDFGLGPAAFTFVAYDHFWDHNLHAYLLPRDHVDVVFRDSHIHNGYRMDHGHFVVDGLGRDHIALVTHHDVVVVNPVFHDARIARHVEFDRASSHQRGHETDRHHDRRDQRGY